MKVCPLGTTDIRITSILLGTWQAGRRGWTDIDDQQVIAGLRAGVEAGVTTIDTAEIYGDGYSERILAQALADQREHLVYATKVFAHHLKYDQVIAACEGSLKNLQTDYIDLYQIHWPSGTWNSDLVPIEETMRALNHLKQQGKIRAIGVSNFSLAQLKEAAQYGRIDSLQPPYSLFWRWVETDLMPYCIQESITILAYSPLAQGLLTGKFGSDHRFAEGDNRAKNRLFQGRTFQLALQALEQLQPIAQRYNTTLTQLALAWVIAQPQTCAIAGMRNPDQAIQNAQAGSLVITPEDLKQMDQISRTVTDSLDTNPVMWNFAS